MRNKPSPADIDLAINQAKHGGWIDPTDEPDCWECLLAKPTGGAMRALCLILALVALAPQARAQPLPPDQACSEIVKTLDRITGHRDSNQEAVRRGFKCETDAGSYRPDAVAARLHRAGRKRASAARHQERVGDRKRKEAHRASEEGL